MELEARYKEQERKNRNAGILGALVSLGLILAVLFSLGLYYRIPPPDEISIDVIFGEADAGSNMDPASDPATEQNTANSGQPDQDLTQDIEDAPSIDQNPANPNPVTTNTQNQQQTQTTRRPIDLPNLEGRNPGGSGEGEKPGQQGNPNGGDDGSPVGTGPGNGTSLGNRKVTRIPTARAECLEKGQIMVKIIVSPQGKVITAQYEATGSTTSNTTCVNEALQLARQYEYEPTTGTQNASGLIKILLQ